MRGIRLLHCENATAMRELAGAAERFTLAYLDPPFFTGRDFETADGEHAYSDKWPTFDSYLDALLERAALAFELLTDSGSLVIHVDPTVSHYVKVRGDELFGRENFASEIVWRYRRWPTPTRNFQAMHDVLLRWTTGRAEPTWNQLYEPLSQSTRDTFKQRKQRATDSKWRAAQRVARTTDEISPGAALSDVWELPIVAPSGDERTGYPTQKPEALLKRLVISTTDEGDAVLDPYMGSGTTLAVCYQLGRRAVGIDQSAVAHRYASDRLRPLLNQPGLFDDLASGDAR